MRTSMVLHLSRPSSSADRARFALVVTAVTVVGALVLWSQRVAGLRDELVHVQLDLTPFATESRLRIGTTFAGLVLCLPVGALLLQSLVATFCARALRPRLMGAMEPENLRAP